MSTHNPIPVTVLTGFLGSGKTTLLNRILTENHGQKIAVIENEFGEIGVDNDLVIGAEEEIFEMNNGCICCTVRGDLIRILNQLLKRKNRFDRIIIETTGLADPSPVAQTFFTDEDLKDQFKLDGIITTVDTKHVDLHINDGHECREQIAFADVILLNKIDLVDKEAIHRIKHQIHHINHSAKIFETENCAIDLNKILDIAAFDLDKIGQEQDKEQEEKDCHDPHCSNPDHHHHHHDHDCHDEHCDHPDHKKEHNHSHLHDHSVSSVGVEINGAMDLKKLDAWIGWILNEKGTDIFRMKGIFNIDGKDERFVFQGVHMLFDAKSDRKWKSDEKRYNKIIFIGKNLQREELEKGIKMCLA